MPFPVQEKYIIQAETKLGVRFPQAYRQRLMAENGGAVDYQTDRFTLYPVLDSSDRKRLKRTCNDIVLETKNSHEWHGFPEGAVALGDNGCGDKLVLLPDPADKTSLSSTLYWWDHETAELNLIADDIGAVL